MEADLNGSVAEPQGIPIPNEAAPSSDSGPAIAQGESSPVSLEAPSAPSGSDETPPPESTEPTIDEAAFQAWLKKQIAADPDAFHKTVTQDENYRKVYQKHTAAQAKAETATAMETLRLEGEHNEQMVAREQGLAKLTAEQRDGAMWDDATARQITGGELDSKGFRKFVNDVADWRDSRTQAPTRNKIFYEAATAQVDGLHDLLSSDPDWKATVSDWDKFAAEALEEHGQTPHAYVAHIKKLVDRQVEARHKAALPGIRASVEAEFRDKYASRIEGEPQPEFATAGVGASNGHYQAVMNKAANPDSIMTSADWDLYREAEAKGFHPRRNN